MDIGRNRSIHVVSRLKPFHTASQGETDGGETHTPRNRGFVASQAVIGVAAMLERIHPLDAIDLAVTAEEHGFGGTIVSDHFQPWQPQGGQSSHAWTVLGALGAQTHGSLGTFAVTAGYRVHPAVIAQASASLAAMFPGRHWLGLGAGDALNEHVTGGYWPEAPERIGRMFEALEVIQKLFAAGLAEKDVRHRGLHFQLESSRLWTMPSAAPEILISTAGPVTARRAGRVADGIVTNGTSLERAALLLKRFDEGQREAGRAETPGRKVVRLDISWAPTDEEAMLNAMSEWSVVGLRFPRGDVRSPFELEQMLRTVRPEDLSERMSISADPDVHRAHIQQFLNLGFTEIHLHNAGRNTREWIKVFGRDVLTKVFT